MDYIQTLTQANILHVIRAARAAGLSFRNGLTKAEIISRLNSEGLLALTVQALGDSPTPEPAKRAQAETISPDASSALIDAIRAVTGKQAIDRTEVEAICAEYVDTAVSNLDVGVTIHLPEKPEPIKFEGLAHKDFPRVLLALQCGLNVILCGPASSGKTHAADMAAKALEKPFRIQGAISASHELLGYKDASGTYQRTPFRDAFEKGGIILLDEMDGSCAEAPLVVTAMLSNGYGAFPDGLVAKHPDFLCIAATNTDGSGATMAYSGRARLDGAFLDRFIQIQWGIDPKIEKSLARGNSEWLTVVHAVRAYAAKMQVHDVIATSRAVAYGATLLAAGETRENTLTATLRRGVLADDWGAVLTLPEVAEFLIGF